ncbi:MAG: hypothetical protein ACYC5N_06185 [Endomicrobiales bacterium]
MRGNGQNKSKKNGSKKRAWVAPKLNQVNTNDGKGSLVVGAEGYGCSYAQCALA